MVSAKRLPEDVDAGMLHWRLEQLHKSLIAGCACLKQASKYEKYEMCVPWS